MAEHAFSFSEWPARWGPTITSAVFAVFSLIAHLAIGHDRLGLALILLLLAIVIVGASSRWLIRSAVISLPWSRRTTANLVATPRGSVQVPEIWLVAHVDSKSQTIPMLARIAAVALSSVCYAITLLAVLILIVIQLNSGGQVNATQSAIHRLALLSAFCCAVMSIPLIVCLIGNKSHGAVDNASGFAAVLLALDLIRDREKVGVIVTSGEELGLAGARAFVAQMPKKGTALNCDTVDDNGPFLCMVSGRLPRRLSEALDRALMRVGTKVRKQAMLPGVLADNIAFSQAGWDSFTLSRGNLSTLARVHTSRDRSDQIEGTGIAIAAELLAATAEELS